MKDKIILIGAGAIGTHIAAMAIKHNVDIEMVKSIDDVKGSLSDHYRPEPMVMPIVAAPEIKTYEPPLTRKQRRALNRKKS